MQFLHKEAETGILLKLSLAYKEKSYSKKQEEVGKS